MITEWFFNGVVTGILIVIIVQDYSAIFRRARKLRQPKKD